ncbi:S-adenosyl-L-methionine-dependent methyltransferases superfamily protein [Striga hermonthica]|uniref:S-adenosyl-L-methionine-dependent methyltransferases superfamily protein n=1 Tax=Striga hermonthica TaxID=68872 RepID=A0A9N7NAZ2_STRHE|nr:S-adenosyl-L-methionine-dependent methyltransferases superfamily protein [Striga hermonthica]
MNTIPDHEQHQLLSSPPAHARHRHPHLRSRLSRPKAYLTLSAISAFILGYISHSHISEPARDLSHHNYFSGRCSSPVHPTQARQTIIDRVFNGTSPWDGFPPPHVSPHLHMQWTKGWGSTTPVFNNLIRQARPDTIIEVGTFLGASSIHMAGLARRLGLDAQIICIDDFRGWPGYYDDEKSLKMVNGDSMLLYQFMQNVVSANETGSIIFLPFSAGTALNGLCEWGVYGDLVEVDAAHDFHSAWTDINRAYKVVRPGGVLFGHDYAWDGVRAAVHLFARLKGFRVRLDGEHWGSPNQCSPPIPTIEIDRTQACTCCETPTPNSRQDKARNRRLWRNPRLAGKPPPPAMATANTERRHTRRGPVRTPALHHRFESV